MRLSFQPVMVQKHITCGARARLVFYPHPPSQSFLKTPGVHRKSKDDAIIERENTASTDLQNKKKAKKTEESKNKTTKKKLP